MAVRSASSPRVRRPRGGVFGAVRIVYVEGRGYYVEPADPAALPGRRTLALCRRYKDAVAFVDNGAAEELLRARLVEVAA